MILKQDELIEVKYEKNNDGNDDFELWAATR